MGGVGVQLEGIKAAPHNPSLRFLGVWLIERGASTEPVVETVQLTPVNGDSTRRPMGTAVCGFSGHSTWGQDKEPGHTRVCAYMHLRTLTGAGEVGGGGYRQRWVPGALT